MKKLFYTKTISSMTLFISLALINTAYAEVSISQFPLITSGGAADNLVLVPSVEFPTVDSVANISNTYSSNSIYGGYFDSNKCYKYSYSSTESERHFYPVSQTITTKCNGSNKEWSGNYLNWATTQTIDSFRSALTGGYRVKDTPTETWLEKARHDRNAYFPMRRVPETGDNAELVKSISPFLEGEDDDDDKPIKSIRTAIGGFQNKMLFSFNGKSISASSTGTAYNPSSNIELDKIYEVSVRVKVCVNGLLESNCQQYGSNYKPEGVIQEYSNRLRYSVFGYLNDSSNNPFVRDGAVLRARQKSVGPYQANLTNDELKVPNEEAEWDKDTGVLNRNPTKLYPSPAFSTSFASEADETNSIYGLTSNNYKIKDSGVINYINKFGQMTSSQHKSYDSVSEMFYAGLRYLRNKGNVDSYSNMTGLSQADKYKLADGFPVITNWGDPYEAACQSSAFLGIGDVYTHRDKNLPGSTATYLEPPSKPPEVLSDTEINVISLTSEVGALENIANLGTTTDFTGRSNSAYMAGLAWYANTRDIRPDHAGKQTAATFWVDVLEDRKLEGIARNQYALAAKYGGFRVPEDFNPLTHTGPLPEGWWHTNNDTLNPASFGISAPSYLRPDNFFTAGESDKIVHSIKQVFARIIARVSGSGAGLASNSTKMVTGSKVFQAVFFNKSWHGELKSYTVNTQTGQLNNTPDWLASEQLPEWDSRNIYTKTAGNGYTTFEWDNLDSTQKTALESQDIVDYLRGNNEDEQRNGGSLRDRFMTTLGDIVHSQPVLVSRPNPTLYSNKSFSGAQQYSVFANTQSARKPVLYVGANDGMLHSFDVQTGEEVYAFIPNSVIMNNLKKLSKPDYQHQYYVDGELTVADVYVDGTWKTILVGTLGAGGKAVFALDVTDPEDVGFLWEKNATQVPALGNNLSKPVIAQTADGQWHTVLGNGPNSTGDKAQLIMFDIATGNETVLDTAVADNNGLAGVTAWSTYANGISDVFYAGDLKGNVWKFSPTPSSTPVKLFTAIGESNNVQPITTSLLAGIDPEKGEFWLFFGTGKYLAQTDLSDESEQSWYGLKITSDSTIDRNNLLKRRILLENNGGSMAVRVSDISSEGDLNSKSGWYFKLSSTAIGERMVVPNIFQGDALIGTVRIPDASDICKPTGRGFVIALNPFTGGRLDRIFFDVNGDQEFDESDNTMFNGESTIVSGVGFDSSPNSPLFIGNVMQVVQDDGTITSILTQGPAASAGRTSWHEIINTP